MIEALENIKQSYIKPDALEGFGIHKPVPSIETDIH